VIHHTFSSGPALRYWTIRQATREPRSGGWEAAYEGCNW